jgi:hypothetical protein
MSKHHMKIALWISMLATLSVLTATLAQAGIAPP